MPESPSLEELAESNPRVSLDQVKNYLAYLDSLRHHGFVVDAGYGLNHPFDRVPSVRNGRAMLLDNRAS